jgi:2-dehydropantoate 2-reductase
MNDNFSRLMIAGTGAMACLFSARLAAIGRGVTHLGTWTEGLEALQTRGVRLIEANGDERNYPVEATRDPQLCKGTRFALVLVKSWQTERVAQQLRNCLHQQGVALTLQNGLGNDIVLAEALGPGRVALGVTTTGATLLSPGTVKPVGDGTIMLGDHPRMKPLADLLRMAGFRVKTVKDTTSLLWGKLVINSAINPLTALLNVCNGELLERPEARDLMAEIALETAAVAKAIGINLPYADPVEAVEGVANRTAANRSSMLSDVLRGRPTEINAINGAVVRTGEEIGIPTPLNQTLWQLVSAWDRDPSVSMVKEKSGLVPVG